MKRYGMVIKIKPEKLEEYKKLHAPENHWPKVKQAIQEAGQRNFTIFHKDEFLFGYFEYTGDDFEADMKKLAEKPIIKEWLALTDPCQEPLETRKQGEWWAYMEEIYHNE